MSFNTFGRLFRVTTWGESHGPAIGCVIDGCPPRIALSEGDIQPFLDARRPGTSRFVTQRKEPDRVTILSGVFEGLTTGTPISLMIENTDQRSRDYSDIKDRYRPGHADYTYDAKYGHRDYRGGGRSSARETAMRVAAGAVARKIVAQAEQGRVTIRGAVVSIGDRDIDRDRWDWGSTTANPFWCPDPVAAKDWETYLDGIRKSGDSVGAIVEVQADGVPAGWGAPVYAKLDAEIAAGLMSINAAKGVEIGDGFTAGRARGTDNADEMRIDDDGRIDFLANHSGGIQGGISNGNTVTARLAIKPTSSMLTPTRSVTARGQEVEVVTKGRHDPCVGLRAVPVAEAMLACALADAFLMHRAQVGG
ncbi:chorismate synthase [uncultured Algimonas sp.]|uniref:chorismate synthase n=1 Tax=uncultured Algimonas sp. TaxID=1547920 RepID=UPI002638A7D2|nr:chorismate synthase [uncultured Algimonas sp.]